MKEKQIQLDILRHSAAHLMAAAVKELYPDVKFGIGPAIKDGFYYDFDINKSITSDDLSVIEQKMKSLSKKDIKFEKILMKKEEALKFFKKNNQFYKVELIENLEEDEVSVYKNGDFFDLCRGPHLESLGKIKVFKLLSVAGAYWKGSEKNPMLQRIYGTAFFNKEDLNDYLNRIEEAKKRDHRKLGIELGFFSMPEEIGSGLILFHPKGAMLRSIIEDYIKKEHIKRNYSLIVSPHILKSDIWIQSGHYDFYKDNMFIFNIDQQEYAVKPMNCPGHILVYKSKTRSYKEFPIKFFELGTVYRNEKSGVLHGLLRVRGFTQDDAHIFCLPSQLKSEIIKVLNFTAEVMETFGFKEFEIEVSTRPGKSIGSDLQWQKATDALTEALEEQKLNFEINKGDGAFYGPKIDIKLKDAIGRTWQCATIQCDFALPERFNLKYVGSDGNFHVPVMLHRVILGSVERFMGTLIEHYSGLLPLWLSAEQVRIIPVAEKTKNYAHEVAEILKQENIRCTVEERDEKVGYKIRQAETEKIPYMLVVGQKEEENKTVSVRSKKNKDTVLMKITNFIKILNQEINSKT